MSAIDPTASPRPHHSSRTSLPPLPSPPPSPTSSSLPYTVLPQPVTDPSLLDSVAGFINDVVPQAATAAAVAYNGVGGGSGGSGAMADGGRDQIQWARFEQRGVPPDEGGGEDVGWGWFTGEVVKRQESGARCDTGMVLVLGYTSGVQVWSVPANGEAILLLSWRHGTVRVLRILPQPSAVSSDLYATKRPLIALCDNATPGGKQYCSLSFISLKTGEQVKVIKFSKPIVDVYANSRSVAICLSERIAIFNASTLEDRLTITTCYPSPGLHPNPVTLGARWLAYADGRLIPARRSGGGNEGEGVQSYTATMLHAAKSLGRGLRELGETVASSLTGKSGGGTLSGGAGGTMSGGMGEMQQQQQKGVVTILDIESPSIDPRDKSIQPEAVIAHFIAHTEAIVCLSFDPSGMLLLTADKRGHDFHLFRIHPHPAGPHLAAVHHLYILHRGDTTARVQDATFSPDSRWCAVTTLRGTTHVFPTTPYGGPISHRTHSTPHIVNRMSRFHRSAGLNADLASSAASTAAGVGVVGRSNSPVPMVERSDGLVGVGGGVLNPRLGPYPSPTIVRALAQIRQQTQVGVSGGQSGVGGAGVTQMSGRSHGGRQRLSSGSDSDSVQVALRVSACFAPPRAWLDGLQISREPTNVTKPHARPVESLFIMSCHGSLIQYDLDPHHCTGIPKEKICDDTSIELSVTAKAQWPLQRQPHSRDLQLPLSGALLSHIYQERLTYRAGKPDHTDDRWLSQVEIVTHAGPHRRLWMGPQFQFQTYQNGAQGTPQNILDNHSTTSTTSTLATHHHTFHPKLINQSAAISKPVNMPRSSAPYPILIEAGSVSSCEPSPKLFDALTHHHFEGVGGKNSAGGGTGAVVASGETQLREDLADAMMEQQQLNVAAGGTVGGGCDDTGMAKDTGGRCVIVSLNNNKTTINNIPPTIPATVHQSPLTKVVNPLGTVVTVTADDNIVSPFDLDTNATILENCDESLFRPVVKSKAVVYAEPICCLQTKNTATNTIHVSTYKPKQKKNGKKIDAKEKTPPPLNQPDSNKSSIKNKKQKQESSLLIELPPPPTYTPFNPPLPTSHREEIQKPNVALQQSLNLDDCVSSSVLLLSVDDAMQEAAIESSEQTILCDFSDVICDYPEQFIAENPLPAVIPDDLDTYAYSPSPSKTHEVSQKKKPMKYDRYQGLEPKDIVVSSSEENVEERTLSKKPRKPKAKLGVRINKDSMTDSKKSEDFSPKVADPVEFEVIPAPKFSWRSVAANTPSKFELPDDHDWTIGAFSTFDVWNEFPKITGANKIDNKVIQKEPTKSWSSILKNPKPEHLDICEQPAVIERRERTKSSLIPVDSENEMSKLEVEVKKESSDDDKPPSGEGEPSAEDDDSPANAMDTEEDAQNGKLNMPPMNKVINKRKSKKKKK